MWWSVCAGQKDKRGEYIIMKSFAEGDKNSGGPECVVGGLLLLISGWLGFFCLVGWVDDIHDSLDIVRYRAEGGRGDIETVTMGGYT